MDSTVIAEAPKIAPHAGEMAKRLSKVLEAPTDRINIKATTAEGLGFCGRGEGIEARAVVTLIG